MIFIYRYLLYLVRYFQVARDFSKYSKLSKETGNNQPKWIKKKLMLWDNTPQTGYDRHYVIFPAWAARVIAKTKPKKHIDISSSLVFSSILSAFTKVDFYDYRPADISIDNLKSKAGDLLNLDFKDNSVKSLSCLHVIEHIGLGRYGDPIDPKADYKAAQELIRVLSIKGDLLIVVPVGKPKIVFNAHKIYSYKQIIKMFSSLELVEFSLIPDITINGNDIIRNAKPDLVKKQNYACGCFWFTKKVT